MMGRKIKSLSSLALVALIAGALIAVLVGASPAPGAPAPPPGGCGGNTGGKVGAARPAAVCPPVPTPPPGGVTTTPTSTTTPTGTTTTPTGSTPVTTPVIGTVVSTTPGGPTHTTKAPTTPVNVIPPAAPAPTPTPAPVTPAVTVTPAATTAAAPVAPAKPHHAKIQHHFQHHKHKPKPKPKHKAKVVPPPKPKVTPPPTGLPKAVQVTSSVPPPQKLRFNARNALVAGALGGFLVLLLAFTSEIFNKTYDENSVEIHGLLTRMGLSRHHLSRFYGVVVYALVGGALLAWLALGEGSDGNPVAVGVALLVALPIVTFAFEFPAEYYLRTRSKIPGQVKVLPTALLIAFVCALVSRAIHLEPAYLYGVFAGYTAARAGSVAEEEEGKSVLVGVAALAVIAGASWFAWGALDAQAHGDHRGWFVILVSTAFFFIFVLGAESLVFGLMPLKYLNGSLVRRWRTMAWLIPQLLAAAFFVYVLMFHGSTKKVQTLDDLIRPFALFVGFGLLSFAFWGYFQWKGRPTAGMGEGGEGEGAGAEAPAAAPPAAAEPAATPAVPQPALLTAANLLGSPALPTQAADTPPPPREP